MSNQDPPPKTLPNQPLRDVPVDWEALEDAFENNAPEVHSYLHLQTGDVLRVVDGVADPQMHARINGDNNYLRIAPVSSREQYRWMERYIPMVEEPELRAKLAASIDGKGAFRRFKDVLMSFATERERWFSFRSERLRVFMEAWLTAHALRAVSRPEAPEAPDVPPPVPVEDVGKRLKGQQGDTLRAQLLEVVDALPGRDLEKVLAFAEFLKARRAARSYAQRSDSSRPARLGDAETPDDSDPPSQRRPAERR
jgi:hypothetical protein